ncbi:Superfamily II DNA and RNA helicase [endosymbiont of Ridgeia piscesae]|jgi:ATP-dependent RNA helicase RhlB|uniref:ATP-dependent RNA helicase RhlB n=1 Tax=endosymbiont of Ridgeia piscesae TaxID=54398 RepID=A0A0T5Z3D7_9GAMM|nr:ATP-dependent RNA helicase RhlB [endosymbiont of Ridgeia piscesae]KRT53802.1 Superfamily II DNA and RNA helicase [endosymbiont of Ridgeia piscesae]KRT57442.1 ATP-dependent RNA helicase RhlB [endosymbiont of Ridgeia piscesae]
MSKTHLTDTRFDQFDLAPELLQGITEAGFIQCTPIQAETLPIALAGNDVAGQAQTGTGKTAAFLVATLQHLIDHPSSEQRRPNQPRALMLAPTRELAVQIHKDAEALCKHTDFTTAAVYGGTGYEQQRNQLQQGVDILVGTPGRLIDYFKQHVYNLNEIQVVVLDEADRMFDLGFIKDIRYLLRRCPGPTRRLGMLFSATLSYRVQELAYEHMNNPQHVEVQPEQVTAEKVREIGYMVANEEKIPLLIGLLRRQEASRTIVFVNTKRVADKVWGFLQGNQIDTAVLSGDVPQKKRLSLLNKFQSGELSVLVATDVAARGLHIPDVTHVVNYDLPEDAEDYVHRIGRTARAGASGDAISFACETYAFSLPDIAMYTGHAIPMETVSAELLAEVDPKSRIYPDRSKRVQHRSKDGRKHHGRSHSSGHHKKHDENRAEGDKPKRPRHRHRHHPEGTSKNPQ